MHQKYKHEFSQGNTEGENQKLCMPGNYSPIS